MKLIECYIENFGKLSDFKLSFSAGLNTVKKDNGYGKTTLTVFIKAMFFGLDDTKKTRLESNDRKHYMPWQGGRCGGSLCFEANGKRYLIERTFSNKASEDTFKLYDNKTGKESLDFSENIGEELFGIDADGFERTVFLSEANLSGKNENKSVSAKLSDLVGCDGDLSVMDDAIELLEKQRKVYYKRGGSGEIGDLRRKAAEIEREINDLMRMRKKYSEEEKNLAAISGELERAYELRKSLIKEAKAADEARLKRIYVKQYNDMRQSIEKDEETKAELERFFKNGFPTAEEIEEAKELAIEAKRLTSYVTDGENEEFTQLSQFFSGDVADEEFDKIKLLAADADNKRKSAEIIEKELLSGKEKEPDLPIKADEAEEHISALGKSKAPKKVNKGWRFAIPLGFAVIIAGIALGFLFAPILFAISLPGAVICLIGIKSLADSKKSKTVDNTYAAARAFIKKCGIESKVSDEQLIGVLYEIKAELVASERTSEHQSQLRERLELLKDEISLFERDACEFIGRFPLTNAPTVKDAINEILRKRYIYTALLETQRTSIQKREQSSLIAKEYIERSESFIKRFPTVTSRPFDEISSKLVEYTALCRSLGRMKESLEQFAREHGIISESINESEATSYTANPNDPALNEKISELERSKALSERQCRIMSEEIERIDELTEEKELLYERASEYEKRLDIILKTKEYLGEAKDSLTSKYLSKTKAAFDKYITLITRETACNFQMDTSFAVMKNERGSLKPQEAYSRGTRDLYALAARFALIESLYEGERPFVILDDPFAYFDDSKLSGALSAIEALAKEKQIIYLTCSKARTV